MAKAKTRTRYVKPKARRRAKTTIPMAVVLGMTPLAVQGINGFRSGGVSGMLQQMTLAMTGFYTVDSKWYPSWMKAGLMPIAIGYGVHWLASKFGVNRAIGRSGLPLLRV